MSRPESTFTAKKIAELQLSFSKFDKNGDGKCGLLQSAVQSRAEGDIQHQVSIGVWGF